ncbi:MAG: DegT/DnrJ/EryC1/StrS family aminotransferase [Spirochaetes bacterium]|nr:DegT/DnrJ/EryC1/StrS family aminotransferase [Spirochaetota bacterium]
MTKVRKFSRKPKLTFPMWPQFAPETLEDIQEPIRSGKVNYWTGTKGMEFEKLFAEWEGSAHAVSCTNGTAALHTAIASLDIGPGDEVIVPSYSFIASSFAIVQAGAIPVFCDVTEDHTIDPVKIKGLITDRTKGIIVVHLYGVVADMEPILSVAEKYSLKVIEDCAQAFGGVFKGKKVGTIGDIGCFSFCQSKHFTTGGEGGMVVTDDNDLAWECRSFRDHGYDVQERLNLLAMEEKLPYIHNRVGFNYRMTEIQSIIGINELKRFDAWNLSRRLQYAALYDEAFRGVPGIKKIPVNTEDRKNSYWWYPLLIDTEVLKIKAPEFCSLLTDMDIPCYGIQWPEAYEERAYRELRGFGTAQFPFISEEFTNPESVNYSELFCPTAHQLRNETVSLFLHPTWEPVHIERCIEGVLKIVKKKLK